MPAPSIPEHIVEYYGSARAFKKAKRRDLLVALWSEMGK